MGRPCFRLLCRWSDRAVHERLLWLVNQDVSCIKVVGGETGKEAPATQGGAEGGGHCAL